MPTSFFPYLSLSGTSQAAPVVAGTVALMLEANPALTPNAVKAILQYTAQIYPEYDPLTEGAGFLNAQGAVELARFFASPSSAPYPSTGRVERDTDLGKPSHIRWTVARGGQRLAHQRRVGKGHDTDRRTGRLGRDCTADCEGSPVWEPWQTSCGDQACTTTTWGSGTSSNVVWGASCGGADCHRMPCGTRRREAARSVGRRRDTVVWGIDRRRHGRVGLDGRRHGRVGLDRLQRLELRTRDVGELMSSAVHDFGWCTLPRIAQLYVTATVMAGVIALIVLFPLAWPDPLLFLLLILASCLTSAWKVNLPIPLASGSTLSVSYAADLTALLLLGPGPAVIVALAGAWTQCTFNVRQREPLYRTAFSLGAIAITMWATGLVYGSLGGMLAPQNFSGLAKPLLGAIGTYFVVNTGLIAVAIACSTRQSAWKIWHRDFLWSGTSFVVAATAGAVAAIVIARGSHWEALLMIAPVYLIYRTYQTIIGRLEDQRRHLEETHRLHDEAVIALAQARKAEQALTAEKERLGGHAAQHRRRRDRHRCGRDGSCSSTTWPNG